MIDETVAQHGVDVAHSEIKTSFISLILSIMISGCVKEREINAAEELRRTPPSLEHNSDSISMISLPLLSVIF